MSWVRRWNVRSVLFTIFVSLAVALPARWAMDRLSVRSAGDGAWASVSLSSATDRLIEALQTRLSSGNTKARSYSLLGNAYLQKARETSDPSYYGRAQEALERALQLAPDLGDAMTGMGVLSLARHEFQDALRWGEQVQAREPHNARAYGILGDAYVELGRYDEAWAAYQKMMDLRPDISSFARVSYARETTGDIPGAVQAMQQAMDAGAANTENANWSRVQLGHLYFNKDDRSAAEAQYRKALAIAPGYLHAQAGLARVMAAKGDYGAAIIFYQQATEQVPFPEYLIALGDVFLVAGRLDEAAKTHALVEVEQRLYQASGVNTDMEMALFNADHGRHLPEALQRARREYERRPSIWAADVLAWTLYQNGEFQEAAKHSTMALRLGTKNALMLFHAGMIQYRLGDAEQATILLREALRINPYFSLLYREEALQTLEALGSPSGQQRLRK